MYMNVVCAYVCTDVHIHVCMHMKKMLLKLVLRTIPVPPLDVSAYSVPRYYHTHVLLLQSENIEPRNHRTQGYTIASHAFEEEAKTPMVGACDLAATLKADSPEGLPGSRRLRCKLWICVHQ